jgi:hypothetical protein
MNTKLRVKPKMNYRCVVRSKPPLDSGKIYTAEIAFNQPDHIENGLIFCGGYLLSKGEYTIIEHKTK